MDKVENYSQAIKVQADSKTSFKALNEGLNIWWGSVSNASFELNGVFSVTFDNGYWWRFKIIEFTPNENLTWKCIDGEPEFNKEWIGHELHWIIRERGNQTLINFNQIGLTPHLHCYDVCSSTWDMFIAQKLKLHLSPRSNST